MLIEKTDRTFWCVAEAVSGERRALCGGNKEGLT